MKNEYLHSGADLLTRFFAGEATLKEQQHVMHWKEATPENLKEFETFQTLWLTMGNTSLEQDIDVDAEWKRHIRLYNKSFSHTGKSFSITTVLRLAASVLILAGLSYFFWNYATRQTVVTNLTETTMIVLPDGSKVSVNAGSKLVFQKTFDKELRKVTLEGEAFFEVRKNPKVPFVIQLDGMAVKVLGTSFNVKAYRHMPTIEVTVTEGKVSMYEKGKERNHIIINKGETASCDKNSDLILKQSNKNRNYLAWKTHSMIFENESLSNISRLLQEVYHKEVILQNSNLGHCTVTSEFIDKDLETVLKILESTLDLIAEEKDGKIYLNGKGC